VTKIKNKFYEPSLEHYGIYKSKIKYNLSVDELYNISISKKLGELTKNGVLVINTGKFTGRSPKDRYIVIDEITKTKVWWSNINIKIDPIHFDRLYKKMSNHLSNKELYVRDCSACSIEKYRLNIRVISELPWSDIFVNNMFNEINVNELKNFKEDWIILNAPSFLADPIKDKVKNKNFSIISFSKKTIIIGGTGYTGEIKKGVFSVLNFTLPVFKNVLPMHCSANTGIDNDTSIFFGLSGTGKTTLSTDDSRKLIGDDEHGWTPNNRIFNFEGGCYAKVLNISKENENEIWNAIKPGALLENVILDNDGFVDYSNESITQNTRVSYPIHHINNIMKPSCGSNLKNIFFLTADAFGILPPISKLNSSQSAYHFISGYTSKLAGTEEGINKPKPSFSACFGAPFLPLNPIEYAEMLINKMKKMKVNVWLINTGWSGGPYGIGKRINIKYTRAMIKYSINGKLEKLNKDNYNVHTIFKTQIPKICPNVPDKVLCPELTWNNKNDYHKSALILAKNFKDNFRKYINQAGKNILNGGPKSS